MNHYTELLYYLKSILEKDDFVNTVTRGNLDQFDLNKMNVSPIANIFIDSPNFGNGQTISFEVEVAVLGVVDYNKEVVNDKFWGNDNEVDVLNESLATLNRMYNVMLSDFEKEGITAEEGASADAVDYTKNNMTGWVLNFTVVMPNNKIKLCQ